MFVAWLLTVIAGAAGAIIAFNVFERWARRRRTAWPCPSCGRAFGEQRRDQFWLGRHGPGAGSGPVMHCARCERSFRLDTRGRPAQAAASF